MDRFDNDMRSNSDLKINVEDGKIYTQEVIIKKQEGAVIYGVVLFEDKTPVKGATVIINKVNKNNKKVTPISFMFTDENGVFIFGIQNTKYDYLINVAYNESI